MTLSTEEQKLSQLTGLARQARLKLEEVERERNEPLAIVGIGCRFPGGGNDPETFWEFLRLGRSGIVDVPADRWAADDYYDPTGQRPGSINNRRGGFLSQIGRFEPEFFGISSREASQMDPQQYLFLEVCWEALENAGIVPGSLVNTRTGVFVGACSHDYVGLRVADFLSLDAYSSTGSASSIIANRISYLLGLSGPSLVVDTACSSSLVSLHLAAQSLRSKESNLAIVGGVNLVLSPAWSISFSRFGMLAPDGQCKTFDASADGFARADGAGVVVLKRASDARRDGDRIWALFRSSAINQDGRSNGLTAPNPDAQRTVIAEALSRAGLEGADLGYVEAHGTGTSLGDPIEVEALREVLGGAPRCLLGSVKTNIGHTEGAAGIAGVIKVALSLHHEQVPPHLNFTALNPHISLDGTGFEIPTSLRDWSYQTGVRRAGVSSFGFGGTNAHVILEEASQEDRARQVDPLLAPEALQERSEHILALSARDGRALQSLAMSYRERLTSAGALADLCYTNNARRTKGASRLCVRGKNGLELSRALECAISAEPSARLDVASGSAGRPRVVFMFTGQGGQYHGMAKGLYRSHPAFRRSLQRCDEIVSSLTGRSIIDAIYAPESNDALLESTDLTQLSLFCVEYALAEVWGALGVVPEAAIGHSVGEIVAATAAGVMSLEDGLRCVEARGRLMKQAPGSGGMLAVYAAEDVVRPLLQGFEPQISLAAVNSCAELVLSGEKGALDILRTVLTSRGLESRQLRVSHAFHSPMMDPILGPFSQVLNSLKFSLPRWRLISNETGGFAAPATVATPEYWLRHARAAVRFREGLSTLVGEGFDYFVEIGPHAVLSGIGAREHSTDVHWLPSLRRKSDDWSVLLAALGKLFCAGADLDWEGLDRGWARRIVSTPTYPWQRRSYLSLASRPAQAAPSGAERHPLLGAPLLGAPLLGALLPGPGPERAFEAELRSDSPSWLAGHRVAGRVVMPASGFLGLAHACARSMQCQVSDLRIEHSLVLPEGAAVALRTRLTPEHGGYKLETFSLSNRRLATEASAWQRHATARVLTQAEERPRLPAPDVRVLRERCKPVDLHAFYAQLSERGIAHGDVFRCIQSAHAGNFEAVCELRPGVPDLLAQEGYFGLHPVLTDVALQAVAMALFAEQVGGSFLPVQIGGVQCPRPFAWEDGAYWHARVDRPEGNPQLVVAQASLFSRNDELLLGLDQIVLQRAVALGENPTRELSVRDAVSAEARRRQSMHTLAWVPIDAPRAVSTASRFLVLAGTQQREWTRGLVTSLHSAAGGCQLAIADASAAHLKREDGLCFLDPDNVAQVDAWLDLALESSKHTNALVILASSFCAIGATGSGGEAQIVSAILTVLQALARSPRGRVKVWVVTCGAQQILPGDRVAEVGLVQTGVHGLAAVAEQEHPGIWGGLLEIEDGNTGAHVARWLVEAACSGVDEVNLAVRGEQLFAARLGRGPERSPSEAWLSLSPRRTYLITGGLGALGLEVARWLVRSGARHLALAGRRAPGAAAQSLLDELQALGADVRVFACDIAEAAAVDSMLTEIAAGEAPLGGIIHAAGVIDDGLITGSSKERVERVLRPKVAGAWHLHRATQGLELEFYVFFSSAAAVLGSVGQASYAAANSWLDGLARYRRALGLPAVSIQWGPWASGMAARVGDHVRARWARHGLRPMSAEDALSALELTLADQVPVLGVWDGDAENMPTAPGGGVAPLLRNLVEARRVVRGRVRRELLEMPRGARSRHLLAHLLAVIGRAMGSEGEALLAPTARLFDVGVDSLMAVEIRNVLQSDLDLQVGATVLFEHPTPAALVQFLLDELGKDWIEPPDQRRAVQVSSERAHHPARAQAAGKENLEGLDARSIAALLLSELREGVSE